MITLSLALMVATQHMVDTVDLIDAKLHMVKHIAVVSSPDSKLHPKPSVALQVMAAPA